MSDEDDNVVHVNFQEKKKPLDIDKLIEELNKGFAASLPPAFQPQYHAMTGDDFLTQMDEMEAARLQFEAEEALTPKINSYYIVIDSPTIECKILETFRVYVGKGLPKAPCVKVQYTSSAAAAGEIVWYTLPSFLEDHTIKP